MHLPGTFPRQRMDGPVSAVALKPVACVRRKAAQRRLEIAQNGQKLIMPDSLQCGQKRADHRIAGDAGGDGKIGWHPAARKELPQIREIGVRVGRTDCDFPEPSALRRMAAHETRCKLAFLPDGGGGKQLHMPARIRRRGTAAEQPGQPCLQLRRTARGGFRTDDLNGELQLLRAQAHAPRGVPSRLKGGAAGAVRYECGGHVCGACEDCLDQLPLQRREV